MSQRQSKYIVTQAFPEPNYTQTPNDFFEMLPTMEHSEIAVTLVMIRNTFGFHRTAFKMGIGKLADAAGISRNSAKTGAEAAEERGTFRRTNPDEQTEAEWELVVGQPLTPINDCMVDGQPLTPPLSTIDSQVGVKESIKKVKEILLSESEYREANAKVDAILAGSLDTQRLREKTAIDAFESAFGLDRPWNWYPAKTSEEKTWRDFRAYVVEKYEADPQCFTRYVTWRNQKYSKGTMSNLAIKRSPQDFPDSWVMFLASDSMYGNDNDKSFML